VNLTVCRGALDVSKALDEAFNKLGFSTVKPEQHKAVARIIEDVFVVLPTGFGKSACYHIFRLYMTSCFPVKSFL